MCWSFLSLEEKSEKKKVLIYSTKNKIVLFCVFAQKTPTDWRNHLFWRILSFFKVAKKTPFWCVFSLQKHLLFELKKFVWYHTNFFIHFCNFSCRTLSTYISTFPHYHFWSFSKPILSLFIISKRKLLKTTLITISFYQTRNYSSRWNQISLWINFAHLCSTPINFRTFYSYMGDFL